MPELFFKGKEFVYNHHLAVPHRPLVPHPERSIGTPGLDGNLIIHGDNLHALKALLPLYAGKVDCIFIDPPYNTGNEGWCYNDNVNSPMMREWLSSNPVGIEDGLRHDKWLAMMWPRLRLLRELLSERGSIWITLDDTEVHRAKLVMDEIFGEEGFVANVVWQKRYVSNVTAQFMSDMHDHILVYAKSIENFAIGRTPRTEEQERDYKNPDNDPRGPWRAQDLSASKPYSAGQYTIIGPRGERFDPPPRRYWRMNRAQYDSWLAENRITFGTTGQGRPMLKRFLAETQQGLTPNTWWTHTLAGHNKEATLELKSMFQGESPFDTPKPAKLIHNILTLLDEPSALVLDSFAGAGTTAHAVLAANTKDGGNRRFILVECEDYADTLTAERVRRVINGYSFQGTRREELHREQLTFTKLKKANDLLQHVESIKNLDGHRFDKIKAEVKDGALIVTGEKQVAERTEGLGGAFTYCTLGEPVELDRLLTGESLPAVEPLAALLFHTATNQVQPVRDPADPESVDGCRYLGASTAMHLWLIYEPDLAFLQSRDAALTLSRARALAAAKPDKPNLVFAAARFVSQRILNDERLNVEYAPLPFALYRLEH